MNSQSAFKAGFKTGNYHPNDYIPFQVTGLSPLGQGSMFILPHVQEQLKSYFEHYGTNNYNGLLIKQRLEQLFPNAKGSRSLVNQNNPNQNARGTEIIDGVLICYTINLKGQSGIFIDDLVWIGRDKIEPKNGLYLVNKRQDDWVVDEVRTTVIMTDHLYIYEGSLRESTAAEMAGSVLTRTYHSDAISKFTLSYTEPSMLKKRGWYPAIPFIRNRTTAYQKSMGYLTSQIKRRSASKVTDIVAHGNGCIYLNDSLKRLSADSLAHLRVLLINPPFPITRFAASFEKAGVKYKNYGFVTSLAAYGSKIKGLGKNSDIGRSSMAKKYVEKKADEEKQGAAEWTAKGPIWAAVGKAVVNLATFSGVGIPVLPIWNASLNLLTRKEQQHDPLMTHWEVFGIAAQKVEKNLKNAINIGQSNNRNSKR